MGPIPFVPVSSLGSTRGCIQCSVGFRCNMFGLLRFERVVAPALPGGVGRPGTRARNPKTASLKDTRVYARRGAGARPAARGAAVRTAPRGPRVIMVFVSRDRPARATRRPGDRRCAPMTSERSRVNEISRVTKYRSPPLSAAAARERGCAHAHMCRPNEPQLPRRVDASARGVRDRWWDF